MTRRVFSVARVLAAGVAINAAVAWSCALWSPLEYDVGRTMAAIEQDFRYVPEPKWLAGIGFADASRSVFSVDRVRGPGIRLVEVSASPDPALFSAEVGAAACVITEPFAVRTSAGWPLASLAGEQLDPFLRAGGAGRVWWPRGGVEIPGSRPGSSRVIARLLPLRPIPFGFIVDSALYAVVLAVVIGGIRLARHRRRIGHGLCPRCRYPIGAAPVCTECGAPVAVCTQ